MTDAMKPPITTTRLPLLVLTLCSSLVSGFGCATGNSISTSALQTDHSVVSRKQQATPAIAESTTPAALRVTSCQSAESLSVSGITHQSEAGTNQCGDQQAPTRPSVRAFPGAEGFGSKTPGGRGGRVLVVTSVQDENRKGTLRWAINQTGRRTVVFQTGGLIRLKKRLVIKNPFITIAGQTAPGSGITLAGGQQFAIRTHDVIIRGLRSRPGDGPGATGSTRDALSIGNAYNVIIDHCVFTWSTDENVSIWQATKDITLSWNIIAQALANSIHEKGQHSMGMIIGNDSHRISIHKNLFASNLDRNPLLKNAYHVELINNYIYGWGDGGVKVYRNRSPASKGKHALNAAGNYLHHGYQSLNRPGIEIRKDSPVFLQQNIDTVYRTNHDEDEFSAAHHRNIQLHTTSTQYKNTTGFRQSGIRLRTTDYVQNYVLNHAGTSSNQHPIDKTIVSSIKDGSAQPIDSVRQMGGYGTNFRGTAAKDNDGDGIPDWFEKKRGFNPEKQDAAKDSDGDGYTNIEEYINSFYE